MTEMTRTTATENKAGYTAELSRAIGRLGSTDEADLSRVHATKNRYSWFRLKACTNEGASHTTYINHVTKSPKTSPRRS